MFKVLIHTCLVTIHHIDLQAYASQLSHDAQYNHVLFVLGVMYSTYPQFFKFHKVPLNCIREGLHTLHTRTESESFLIARIGPKFKC